jgi:hypothetical protein
VDVGAGRKGELRSHRHQRGEDVGEDDRGIEVEPVNRLQRHLDGDLGCAAHRQEVAGTTTDLTVLRQVPARLAHDPDRRPIDRFTTASLQEPIH